MCVLLLAPRGGLCQDGGVAECPCIPAPPPDINNVGVDLDAPCIEVAIDGENRCFDQSYGVGTSLRALRCSQQAAFVLLELHSIAAPHCSAPRSRAPSCRYTLIGVDRNAPRRFSDGTAVMELR